MVSISDKRPIIGLDSAYSYFLKTEIYNPETYDEKRDKKVLRASMAGKCHRLQKYHLSDIPQKDTDVDTMKVFRIGDLYHGEIQSAFKWLIEEKNKDKDYYELLMEKPITVTIAGLTIEGHFDILLLNHKDKKVVLYDIKTMNPRAYSFFKKAQTSKNGYNKQLGVYATWVKENYPEYDLTVILSAISKDSGEFHEVSLDEVDLRREAKDYYTRLAETLKLELDEIKPVAHVFSPMEDWECNYCPFNHICPSPKITRK